nr:O-methyltransferase [Frisingicoccus sp.]
MIVDERMLDYILSLDKDESPLIRTIEQEAVRDYVPIIRKESRNLLKVLLKIKKPGRVLEVGTAIGFSAILMGECLPDDSHITTIEKYEKRIPVARENFKRAGMEEKITLIEGDASEVLKELSGPFDFIFMDAAKGQYIHFFPEVMRLLRSGGVLVSDNVLQDGDVVESRYAVVRRNRTIHSRMREYLWTLKHMDGLETIVLPIGDGMTVSVKE